MCKRVENKRVENRQRVWNMTGLLDPRTGKCEHSCECGKWRREGCWKEECKVYKFCVAITCPHWRGKCEGCLFICLYKPSTLKALTSQVFLRWAELWVQLTPAVREDLSAEAERFATKFKLNFPELFDNSEGAEEGKGRGAISQTLQERGYV